MKRLAWMAVSTWAGVAVGSWLERSQTVSVKPPSGVKVVPVM
jgi:hypothetical protein